MGNRVERKLYNTEIVNWEELREVGGSFGVAGSCRRFTKVLVTGRRSFVGGGELGFDAGFYFAVLDVDDECGWDEVRHDKLLSRYERCDLRVGDVALGLINIAGGMG